MKTSIQQTMRSGRLELDKQFFNYKVLITVIDCYICLFKEIAVGGDNKNIYSPNWGWFTPTSLLQFGFTFYVLF